MYAEVGDRIVMGRDPRSVHYRAGEIIGCPQPDGGPPYLVRWNHDGSEVILLPSEKAFFVRGAHIPDAVELTAEQEQRLLAEDPAEWHRYRAMIAS